MQQIEPTYLRYVYDGLSKGALSSNNAAGLPFGFIGLFEKEFQAHIPSDERSKLLRRLGVWALFKGAVSAEMSSAILDEHIDETKALIDRFTKWFNSPEPGKYVLYHDRLRTYLLQKLSDFEINELNEILIEFLENTLEKVDGSEAEIYALEHLSSHMAVESELDTNYERLHNFVNKDSIWAHQLKVSKEYKWSHKAIQYGIKEGARRHHERNTLTATVNSVLLIQEEKNSAKQILDLLNKGDFETAINRVEVFEGKKLFTMYLLMIHELTIGSSKEADFRVYACREIIKKINESTNGIPPLYYPKTVLLQYQLELLKLGVKLFTKLINNNIDKEKNHFVHNRVLEPFWPIIVDVNLKYIPDIIEEKHLLEFWPEQESKEINSSKGQLFTDMLNEIGVHSPSTPEGSPVIHIKDFSTFNFQDINICELAIVYPHDNTQETEGVFILPLIYCAYRYLRLDGCFKSFINNETGELIDNPRKAAVICFEKAIKINYKIKQGELDVYISNFRTDTNCNILKIIKLFPTKNLERFQDKLVGIIKKDPNYLESISNDSYNPMSADLPEVLRNEFKEFPGNTKLVNLLFEYHLSKDEFNECIHINKNLIYGSIERNYVEEYDFKNKNLIKLLKNLLDKNEHVNYNLVFNKLSNNFSKGMIKLYEAEILFLNKENEKAIGLVYNIYNLKINTLKNHSKVKQEIIALLLKYNEVEDAINILNYFTEFIERQSVKFWISEQYVDLYIKTLYYNIEVKENLYLERAISFTNEIRDLNRKNNVIFNFLKKIINLKNIELFYVITNEFILDEATNKKIVLLLLKNNLKTEALRYSNKSNIEVYLISESRKYFKLQQHVKWLVDSKYKDSQYNSFVFSQISNINDCDLLVNKITNSLSISKPELPIDSDCLSTCLELKSLNIIKYLKYEDFLDLIIYNTPNQKERVFKYIDNFSQYIHEPLTEIYSRKPSNWGGTTFPSSKIVITDFKKIKYLFNILSFKDSKEKYNKSNSSIIDEILNILYNIKIGKESRYLSKQKIIISEYLFDKFHHYGYLKESILVLDYMLKLDIEDREKFSGASAMTDLVKSKLLLSSFHRFNKTLFIKKINKNITIEEKKFTDDDFYFNIKIVLCLIAYGDIIGGINLLKNTLNILFKQDCEGGNAGAFIIDTREYFLEEIINILKKITKGLNERTSETSLKIESSTNAKVGIGAASRYEEKYNENSILNEFERLLVKDYSNFNRVKYLEGNNSFNGPKFPHQIEGLYSFENELEILNTFLSKESKSLLNPTLIGRNKDFDSSIFKHFSDKEYELINHIYKVKDKCYYKSSLHLIEELFYIEPYDVFELNIWNENLLYSYFIKYKNTHIAKINLLFHFAKNELFFNEKKDFNKLKLINKVIDTEIWKNLSS